MPFIRSKLLILLFGFTSIYILFNIGRWKNNEVLTWDIAGYYLYLPAIIIYKDLGHLHHYPKIDSLYRPALDTKWHGIYDIPLTGKKLNKYPIGVALFELPFFLGAHAYVLLSGDYPPDGYSSPYRLAVSLATVFWVLVGLFILRRLLLRYHNDTVVSITLLLIAFGTNLFNYTAFEYGMSHSFSFLLFAAFLYCTELWYSTGRKKYMLLMAVLLGWVVITRPSNIVIVLLPLLWSTGNCSTWKDKLALIKQNAAAFIISLFLFFAVLLLQATYWKYVTGHWIYYSYEQEGFNFLSPHIWDGLFSYRKGWFLYTPMAIVAIGGLLCLYKSNRRLVLPVLIFTIVNIYIVFSWYYWSYGGGFSARALVESFAVLSLPLAAFVAWVLQLKMKFARAVIIIALLLMVGLNMFQTYQYSHGVIMPDEMNKELYWKRFFDIDVKK